MPPPPNGGATRAPELPQLPLKAYAILDGGGVKAAALVGCLRAAHERGIRFEGYGGTSAGSLVAFLAAIGYTPDEMQRLIVGTDFDRTFLPDGGQALLEAREILSECGIACGTAFSGLTTPLKIAGWAKLGRRLFKDRAAFLRLWTLCQGLEERMGLYDGADLEGWITERCEERFPLLRGKKEITLNELAGQAGVRPLRIVASNLHTRAPAVFAPFGKFGGSSITTALRASMSYPFVFRPVPFGEYQFMVDGGLSSNLPMFLFEDERRRSSLPIFAFDLVAAPGPRRTHYRMWHLLQDMLETALEGGEEIQRGILRDLYHIRVLVPEGIDTLDFNLSTEKRRMLELTGYSDTGSYLAQTFAQAAHARSEIERYYTIYARPELVRPVLRAIAAEFEALSLARQAAYPTAAGAGTQLPNPLDRPRIRVSIMLPTGRGTRRVVYQFGMDNDSDSDLEVHENAGVTGLAWRDGKGAGGEHSPDHTLWGRWGLEREQESRVPHDRRAILAVPIRAFGYDQQKAQDLPMIGTLAIDSDWTLADCGWDSDTEVGNRLVPWADVLASLLRS